MNLAVLHLPFSQVWGTQHHCTNTEVIFGAEGTAIAKTATNYHLKTDGTRYDYFGVYEDEPVKTPEDGEQGSQAVSTFHARRGRAGMLPTPRTRLVISQVVLSASLHELTSWCLWPRHV